MKVVTLNTWNEEGPWETRWQIVLKGLAAAPPDIVAFQEVISPAWAQTLSQRLELPHYAFAGKAYGLLTLSRFPLRASELIPYKIQSPTEDYPRGFLMTTWDVQGQSLLMLNTHLSWRLDEGLTRTGQVDELLHWVQRHASAQDLIALGDFNAHEDQPEIIAMTAVGGFTDTFRRIHPEDPGLTWDNRNTYTARHGLPDRRLDYIFVRQAGKALGKLQDAALCLNRPDPDKIFASDHYGVSADFAKAA